MRTVLQTARWQELIQQGDFTFDVKLAIGDKEYTRISPVIITRPGLSEQLAIGECLAASMQVTILTDDVIPPSSEIKVKGRIAGPSGENPTPWEDYGTFYIDDRDTVGGTTLYCLDAMLMLDTDFPTTHPTTGTAINWPMKQDACVELIAAFLGISVDNRTVVSSTYDVQLPYDSTMREVLGYIGACNGGNWVITEDNKLRLIPLINSGTANDIIATMGKPAVGIPVTITGAQMTHGNVLYTAGTKSGGVLQSIENPEATQAITTALLTMYQNAVYQPFNAEKVLCDPAIELGDIVNIKNLIQGQVYNQEIILGKSYRVNISSPVPAEMESEYPYKTKSSRLTSKMQQTAQDAVDAQTQLDVFNKLTNNGQEQGIFLQDGKIYINGEYIDVSNLVVRLLQSYADNNQTFLESEAGYLDIRRYNNSAARWEQRVGIYRNTGEDRGEIRLSSGDVNKNGDFIPGGTAVKSIFTPNILQLGYTRMVDGYIDPTSYTGHINAGTIRGYKGLQGGDGTQSGKLKLSIVQPGGTFSDYYVEPVTVKAADGKSVLAIAQDSDNYITGLTTLSSTQISNVGASVTFDMKGYSAILIQINAEGVSGRSHFEIFPAGNYTGYFRFHQGTNWIQTQIERSGTSVTIYIREKSNTNGNIGIIYGIR